jgi:hypothetical protein
MTCFQSRETWNNNGGFGVEEKQREHVGPLPKMSRCFKKTF